MHVTVIAGLKMIPDENILTEILYDVPLDSLTLERWEQTKSPIKGNEDNEHEIVDNGERIYRACSYGRLLGCLKESEYKRLKGLIDKRNRQEELIRRY